MMRRRLLTLWLLVGLAGCAVTDIGNPGSTEEPDTDVEMQFTGYDSSRSALSFDDGVTIEQAWVAFEAVRLNDTADCDRTEGRDNTELVVVDLVADRDEGSLTLERKSSGDYCKVHLDFGAPTPAELPEAAPAELSGRSLLIEGTRSDGTPFSIRTTFGQKLQLDPDEGSFNLEPGSQHFIVGFEANAWFAQLDLNALRPSGDRIVIDEDSNPAYSNRFGAAFRRSAQMFRDANSNRRLDFDERAEPVARGRDTSNANQQPQDRAEDADHRGQGL